MATVRLVIVTRYYYELWIRISGVLYKDFGSPIYRPSGGQSLRIRTSRVIYIDLWEVIIMNCEYGFRESYLRTSGVLYLDLREVVMNREGELWRVYYFMYNEQNVRRHWTNFRSSQSSPAVFILGGTLAHGRVMATTSDLHFKNSRHGVPVKAKRRVEN